MPKKMPVVLDVLDLRGIIYFRYYYISESKPWLRFNNSTLIGGQRKWVLKVFFLHMPTIR